jgi:hypothetical protein
LPICAIAVFTAVWAPPFGAGAGFAATPGAALRRAVPPPEVVARLADCSCARFCAAARAWASSAARRCASIWETRVAMSPLASARSACCSSCALAIWLRVESSDALWLSASPFDFSNCARRVELFLGDRQVTDEVVVLVGGRRSVLRTARQLGDVPDVEGIGGSAVRGTDVEGGGPAGELTLQAVGALRRGIEPSLGVRDSRGRFVDGELRLVVLLVEDGDALVVGGDLRFQLLGELLLLRELVLW